MTRLSGLPDMVAAPHTDKLGSTRALSKDDGTLVAQYDYDAYGNATVSGVVQPFQFTGQYTDTESGLQYLRARYYDPATEQFLSRDPLVALTQTPYAYVNDSPVDVSDPSGAFALILPAVAEAIVAVVTAVVAFETGQPAPRANQPASAPDVSLPDTAAVITPVLVAAVEFACLPIQAAANFAKKSDLQDVDTVARQKGIKDRRAFGNWLEEEKQHEPGSKNDRGDYTKKELEAKADQYKQEGGK